jgi:hypothetical protein
MNEKAIQDAYNLFAESGYKKSIDDFKSLIKTNPNALNDSYELFKGKGYNKDIESYKSLVGVSDPKKKKETSTSDGATPQKVSATKPQNQTTTLGGGDKEKPKPLVSSGGEKPKLKSKDPVLGRGELKFSSSRINKNGLQDAAVVNPANIVEAVEAAQVKRAEKNKEGLDKYLEDKSKDFDNNVANEGILNKIGTASRALFNTAVDAVSPFLGIPKSDEESVKKMIKVDSKATDKYFEQATDNLSKTGIQFPSKEQIYKEAKSIKLKEDEENFVRNKDAEFLEEVSNVIVFDPVTGNNTTMREALSLNDYKKYKTINKEAVEASNIVKLNNAELDNYKVKIKEAEDVLNYQIIFGNFDYATKLYEDAQRKRRSLDATSRDLEFIKTYEQNYDEASKKAPDPNFPNVIKNIAEDLNVKYSEYDKSIKKYYDSIEYLESKSKENEDAFEALDNSRRRYSGVFGDKFMLSSKETVNGLVKGLQILSSESSKLQKKIGMPGSGMPTYVFNSLFKDYNYYEFYKQIEKERGEVREDIGEVTDANSFLNYISDVGATQSGQMALPAMAGYGKILYPMLRQSAVYFGSGFGRGVGEAENYEERFKRGELEPGEIGKIYSTWEKYLHGSIVGGSDILGNIPTAMRFGKAVDNIFKNPSSSKLFWETTIKKAKEKGIDFVEELSKEVGEEVLAEWLQSGSKIAILKDPNAKMSDGIEDVIKDTATFTMLIKAFPIIGNLLVGRIANSSDSKKIDEFQGEIMYWRNKLQNESLSEETKSIYNDRINKLNKDLDNTIENVRKKVADSPKIFTAIEDLNVQIENTRKAAYDISNNQDITKEEKEKLINSKNEEYNQLKSKRDKLIDGKATVLDLMSEEQSLSEKNKAERELINEAKERGDKEFTFTDEQITKRAIENYEKQSKETTAKEPTKEGPAGDQESKGTTTTEGKQDKVLQETKDSVEELREQELVEFREQVENSEDFITNGKVDAKKVSESDNAKAKEIYAKYDAQIKPLLDNIKTQEDAIQKQSTGKVPVQPETTVSEEVEEGTPQPKTEGVTKEEIVPGSKAVVSGIEITYPTVEQETERKDARSKPEYVEESSKDLDVEDTTVMSRELEGDFGILTAENPMAKPLTEAENVALNNKAKQWLESRGYKPRRLTGKYAQAENSFFVPNLSKADAIAFAKEFNQDSVAHSEGLIYQDGSMNPRVESDDDFTFSKSYDAKSDNVSVVKTKDGLKTFSVGYDFNQKVSPNKNSVTVSAKDTDIKSKLSGVSNKKMSGIVAMAAKSIAKILPNVKFVLHNTNESFTDVSGESKNQASSGLYQNGEIHINLEKANARTVAHEVFHAILLDRVKTDSKAAETTKRMLNAILPTLDKNKALKQRLEDFADNYDENIQDEEKLAELVGILAENYNSLSNRTKEIIKTWLDNLAKMFGVELFESNEVLDVLNAIAKGVATGKEISKAEINIFKGGSVIESPSDLLRKQKVGSFDVMYTEQEKIDKLIKDGLITEPDDTSFMNNEQVAITSPDDMLVGTISIDGKQVFEGGGGVFFVTKYGDVWASGKEGTANTLAKAINNSLKNNKSGKGYLVLTKGSDSKLISSSSGVNSSLSILESMLDKNLISLSDFRSAVSSSIKTFGGEISLRASAKQMKEDINTYFSNPKESTFQRRGDVVGRIIDLIAQSKSIKDNKNKVIEFLGGDTAKGIVSKVTKENKSRNQSLSDLIAGVASEKLTKGLSVGDVYAIIEVSGEVNIKEDSHPSYPFHVVQKNGKKPILHLPKLRENGSKTITTSSGKPYTVGQVSIMSGKFNDTSTRKQKTLPQTVLSKLTETKDGDIVLKHYSDERRDVIKKGQGQNRITSTEESSALSSVGGIAMFYTMANQVEAGVGNVEHTVLVSKDKIYDIDSDPMGFEAEARERFNEVRPGQAFTNNYRGAFITKIANENGFDIAVSQWRGSELRAQTTLELKPESGNIDFKERPLPVFKEGDRAIIDGRESVIEKVDGERLTYRSVDGKSSGVTLNNERNRRSVVKIEPTPAARKQMSFNKKRKAAITNVKQGKYGSLTNTSKSNKETIVEHETMKVKILNLVMLFPKIVENAVPSDLFEKYKEVILAMSEKRLAVKTVFTAQEVADLYDQIIGDYTNFSEIQNAILSGEENTLTKEQKEFYDKNESSFKKAQPEVEIDEDALAEKREDMKDEVMSYIPSIQDAPKQYDTKSMSFEITSLLSNINSSDLDMLSNAELENLRRVMEAISLGEDIPSFANNAYQIIVSNRKRVLSDAISDKYNKTGFNRIPLRRAFARITDSIRESLGEKSWFSKTNLESRAKRYPLVSFDAANKIYGMLPKFADIINGQYGGIPIYAHIFSEIDKAEGAFDSRMEEVNEKFNDPIKALDLKSKDIDESFRKIHFAFLQLQVWGNPGNKKVKSGVDSFTQNAENLDSPYTDKERDAYRKFVNKYRDYQFIRSNEKVVVLDPSGVDVTSEYFTKEEINMYNAIRSELDNQKARAEETSLFNNKNAMPFVNEYFPEGNFSKTASSKSINEDPLAQNFSKSGSLKSKNLEEKTTMLHPVAHNPAAIAYASIRSTELQYQLLNTIQIARMTMNGIIEDNKKKYANETDRKKKERFRDLGRVYDNIRDAVNNLADNFVRSSIGTPDAIDNVSDALTKTFYVGALASGVRTAADLALNYQHLITSEPVAISKGISERRKISSIIKKLGVKSPDKFYRNVLKFVDASQVNRMISVVNTTSVRSEFNAEGASNRITRKGVESDVSKAINKVTKVVEPISTAAGTLNDLLISVSDNMPALSLYIGAFSTYFKEATGQDFDYEKANNNDADYMLKNRDAIQDASMLANFKLATYLGSKNISAKSPAVVSAMRGQGGNQIGTKIIRKMNYFFRQFQMVSTTQYLTALNNMFEVESFKDVSKNTRVMLGSGLRTSLYTAVSISILGAIWNLFKGDDEDEEIIRKNSDELSLDNKFVKELFTIMDKYPNLEEELETLDKTNNIVMGEYTKKQESLKNELISLLKDKRFEDLYNSYYRFFTREVFTESINKLSLDTKKMNEYDKSSIDDLLKLISDKKATNEQEMLFRLSFLHSEKGRSLMDEDYRDNAINKIEEHMEETGYYLLRSKFSNLKEFDSTTPEGKLKSACLLIVAENLLNHRDNSFMSNVEKGFVETGINLTAGVRGNIPVKLVSYTVELINKKYNESKRGYYDFDKDRYNYGTPDVGLSDKKFDAEKTFEFLTLPEMTVLFRALQKRTATDASILFLRAPGMSDANRLRSFIQKDQVYQNTRGKFDKNLTNEYLNKKIYLTKEEKEAKEKKEKEYNSRVLQDKKKTRIVD